MCTTSMASNIHNIAIVSVSVIYVMGPLQSRFCMWSGLISMHLAWSATIRMPTRTLLSSTWCDPHALDSLTTPVRLLGLNPSTPRAVLQCMGFSSFPSPNEHCAVQ